ncbi:MAG: leucine-rich repeat domain-containing protein, partial [Bacteroidales bacterium]|nr:leucine-rich repeat domain-containing protein [Bacteroidales bacterium]
MKQVFTLLTFIAIGLITAQAQTHTVTADEITVNDNGYLNSWTPPAGTTVTDITIPGDLVKDGQPVTEITGSAFRNKSLTKVTIEEGITALRFWTFANNEITELNIPTTLTHIGEADFNNNKITTI